MPRLLPPGYFGAPPVAAAGPELFTSHTCLGGGARAATWAAFRAHRQACDGLPAAAGFPAAGPAPALPAAGLRAGAQRARAPPRGRGARRRATNSVERPCRVGAGLR